MNTIQDSELQDTILKYTKYGQVAFAMSIAVFASMGFVALVFTLYGGAKFLPGILALMSQASFVLFYLLVFLGTPLALASLLQEGAKHRLAQVALTLNMLSIVIVYILYRLYD